jgi:hypothetical protein
MTSGQQLGGAFTTTVAGEVKRAGGGGGGTGALCTGYTLVLYNESKHNILALIGKANKISSLRR